MNTTKQKRRYAIDVPEDVMKVLSWHVETQRLTPEQQESDLLFPAATGGFRSPNVLNKPFAAAVAEMDLGYAFTQRGMRRTFNDLARHARVELIVTRSISGHLAERMQDHYSTVHSDEQRASSAKVIHPFPHKARPLASLTRTSFPWSTHVTSARTGNTPSTADQTHAAHARRAVDRQTDIVCGAPDTQNGEQPVDRALRHV